MGKKPNAQNLITRYAQNRCTETEAAWVEAGFNTVLKDNEDVYPKAQIEAAHIKMKSVIDAQVSTPTVQARTINWRYAVVAACTLLLLAVGTLIFYISPENDLRSERLDTIADITPGQNKAYLTLADGKKVELSQTSAGVVMSDSIRYENGQAVDIPNDTQWITIETPRGGQYRLTLSDGTKVWLNAATKLRYPTQFTGAERVVELVGEAYFEVRQQTLDTRLQTRDNRLETEENLASNVSSLMSYLPFRVVSKGQIIEVLGTSFNVNAYPDDPLIHTAVASGSVRVDAGGNNALVLIPGQQAVLSAKSLSLAAHTNMDDILAWKNGDFSFQGSLEEILKKIGRWYDVEIVYQADFQETLGFVGKISKSKNLSAVLNYMESAGNVRFKIEGRRVIVMK